MELSRQSGANHAAISWVMPAVMLARSEPVTFGGNSLLCPRLPYRS
jgi:hypothetical protein